MFVLIVTNLTGKHERKVERSAGNLVFSTQNSLAYQPPGHLTRTPVDSTFIDFPYTLNLVNRFLIFKIHILEYEVFQNVLCG